jgi:hypothetical protein
VPVVPTKDGLRAVSKGEIAKPESVARFLAGKFGDQFEPARAAMLRLAASLSVDELNEQAFHLYERFRPEAPADEKGRGATRACWISPRSKRWRSGRRVQC